MGWEVLLSSRAKKSGRLARDECLVECWKVGRMGWEVLLSSRAKKSGRLARDECGKRGLLGDNYKPLRFLLRDEGLTVVGRACIVRFALYSLGVVGC